MLCFSLVQRGRKGEEKRIPSELVPWLWWLQSPPPSCLWTARSWKLITWLILSLTPTKPHEFKSREFKVLRSSNTGTAPGLWEKGLCYFCKAEAKMPDLNKKERFLWPLVPHHPVHGLGLIVIMVVTAFKSGTSLLHIGRETGQDRVT